MKTKFLTILILFGLCLNLTAQDRYDQFKEYLNDSLRERNKHLISIKTFQQATGGQKSLISIVNFNSEGLPTTIKKMQDSKEINRQDYIYKNNQLVSIEEFRNNDRFLIAEMKYYDNGLIKQVAESVFSSSEKKKLPAHQFNYLYYPNSQIKQIFEFEGVAKDTVEIKFFNNKGQQLTSYMNYSGLTTKRIEFFWSKDSSESKEIQYDDEGKAYNTIISKFRNKQIVQKIDKSSSPTPFYWKYDSLNRVIETNSGVFYKQNFFYNDKGLLVKQLMSVIEQMNTGHLPKTIEFTYEYIKR